MSKGEIMFTKQSTIGEVLDTNEKYQAIFQGFGMHCFSCPMARMETIEEAASVHMLDADLIVEKLNELQKEEK